MIIPMRITIDEAGRLVIPREVRRAAGLEPGMPLDIRVEDGAVVIEPASIPVTIERRGRFAVARAPASVPPLTERMVRETRDGLHAERAGERRRKKD